MRNMQIDTSQQVAATYARDHFKEILDKVVNEGMQIIIRKSQPSIVFIKLEDLKKLKEEAKPKKKKARKFDLDFIRKNNPFDQYAGCLDKAYPGISSLELSKTWWKYVD